MSAREIKTLDLTLHEQEHVRNAIAFLHVKIGGWKPLGKLLHFDHTTLIHVVAERRAVCASMAFRVARFVGIGIDSLLAGEWPEAGTCPRCGYKKERSLRT
jgi:hypothetical protein